MDRTSERSTAAFEVGTAQPGRSIRASWEDGSTRPTIGVTALGEAKSQVAVAHRRIPDPGRPTSSGRSGASGSRC